MAWSREQQIALAVVPKFSSVLSMVGSYWIIVEVITGKHGTPSAPNWRHSYHRLLFAMSVYDVLESGWNFLSTWPIPRETQDVVWAIGTTQTCTAQGFFLTLSVAVPIYNAFLALYYLLVVNYRVTDRTLTRWVEPAMHAVAFVWAFGTALVSASMGLINNANLWCWIAPYPSGCLDSWRHGAQGNCERGDNAWIYRWGFYFAPLWFCILFAAICTLTVCSQVKRLDKRTLMYRRPERSASFVANDDNTLAAESTRNAIRFTDENTETRDYADASEEAVERNPFVRWWKQRKAFAAYNPRTAEVQQQAAWYLFTFVLTHIWSTSNRIKQQLSGGETLFGLTVIHSFFDPLQGFLNFLVYQRPRFIRIRKENPTLNWRQAIRRTIVFSCRQPERQVSVRWSSRRSVPSVSRLTEVIPMETIPESEGGGTGSSGLPVDSASVELAGTAFTDFPESQPESQLTSIDDHKEDQS